MIELRFLERMRTDEDEGVAKRERILQFRTTMGTSAEPTGTVTNEKSEAYGEPTYDWVCGPWQDVPLVKET